MFPQIHIQLEFQIITLYGNRVSADVACYYEVISQRVTFVRDDIVTQDGGSMGKTEAES